MNDAYESLDDMVSRLELMRSQIHDTKLMIIIIIVISFLVVMALSVAVVWYIYKARDIKAERDLALVRNMQIDIESSEIVSRFRIPGYYPTTEDINRLKEILNLAYDGFTLRLKKLCPTIREEELFVCCMIKIGLPSKQICNISAYKPNSLSMLRSRLYTKMSGQKGSAAAFDEFIRGF